MDVVATPSEMGSSIGMIELEIIVDDGRLGVSADHLSAVKMASTVVMAIFDAAIEDAIAAVADEAVVDELCAIQQGMALGWSARYPLLAQMRLDRDQCALVAIASGMGSGPFEIVIPFLGDMEFTSGSVKLTVKSAVASILLVVIGQTVGGGIADSDLAKAGRKGVAVATNAVTAAVLGAEKRAEEILAENNYSGSVKREGQKITVTYKRSQGTFEQTGGSFEL